MKHIPIDKQGKFIIVDDDDFPFLSKYKWHNRGGKIPYFCRSVYIKGKNPKSIYVHRMIMKAKKGEVVDHIDGNTFDNRKKNLRLCTGKQNSRNRVRLNKNNTSGFKGVSFFKPTGHWMVQVMFNGKRAYTGFFKEKIEAAKKYNEIALKYYGEYAVLNKI